MIDTKSMRAKILDLAMRGQLTEQLPEDGTAEELFQQIQAEKQELIQVGKIKKEKPLPEISKNEIPFDIPENWLFVKLQNISSVISKGTTPRGGEVAYSTTGIGFLRAENLMGYDSINTSNLKYVSEQSHLGFLKRSILEAGDVLVTIAGTLGKTGLVREEDLPLNTNQAIAFVRIVDKNQVALKYIVYALNSPIVQKTLLNKKVDMAIPNLSLNNISNIIIPLPPFTEQQRIADRISMAFSVLDTIDDLQARYSDNLSVLKSKLIDAAIQGKLTEQLPEDGTAEELYQQIQEEKQTRIKAGKIKKEKPMPEIKKDEIPFNLPTNWKWVRIGEVVSFNPRHIALDDEMKVSFVPMPRVLEGYNNHHSSEEKKWKDVKTGYTNFCNGDVGVAKITPCFQNRKSVVFHDLVNGIGAGTTEFTVMRPIGSFVHPRYLLWFCKSEDFIKKGVESFNGSVGQARVDKDYMKMCLLPLPPLVEQQRIVDRLDALFEMITAC